MKNELQIILDKSIGEKKHKQIDDISKKSLKIEVLKKDLETLVAKIKSLKEKVDSKTSETKEIFCKTKEEYIFLLINKYKIKGFTLWEKDLIIEFINEEYRILMDMGYVSEKLQQAIEDYTKQNISNMKPFEKKMAEELLREMLDDMDIDSSTFSFEEMSSPDFKKRIETEAKENFEKQQKKQKEADKKEIVRKTDIDFQKLYKKLAKISHPDLCKNETERLEKESQMKALTLAWEDRNYYEILMLWLVIDPNNTTNLELNEKNHKKIIAQLNEKINDLEGEQYRIKNYFKDTAFYYQNFNAPSDKTVDKKIEKYKNALQTTAERTIELTNLFQTTSQLKKHLRYTYDRRAEEEEMFGGFFEKFGKHFENDNNEY